MNEYRLTPAAQRDLSSMWDYTEEQWDVRQAETYIGEIRADIERVAANPQRGRARTEVRDGYRSYSIVSHVLFYVETPFGIAVIRILHQSMDPARHL